VQGLLNDVSTEHDLLAAFNALPKTSRIPNQRMCDRRSDQAEYEPAHNVKRPMKAWAVIANGFDRVHK
jgi:hypothetical protein